MEKIKKIFLITSLAVVGFARKILAASSTTRNLDTGIEYGTYTTGLGTRDIREGITSIANLIGSFFIIIFSLIFLIGLIRWLINLHKNPEKLKRAKSIMKFGFIAIVVVIILYLISLYIINLLVTQAGAV